MLYAILLARTLSNPCHHDGVHLARVGGTRRPYPGPPHPIPGGSPIVTRTRVLRLAYDVF